MLHHFPCLLDRILVVIRVFEIRSGGGVIGRNLLTYNIIFRENHIGVGGCHVEKAFEGVGILIV